jgi:hypothetical protein
MFKIVDCCWFNDGFHRGAAWRLLRSFGAATFVLMCIADHTAAQQAMLTLQPSGVEALPAGALVLVANGVIKPEHQDLTLSASQIRIATTFRNTSERDTNLTVTFALPELDTAWIWDVPPLLPRSGQANFVDAVATADGEPVKTRLEQRAVALNLDVTDSLKVLGLDVFPYAGGLIEKIAALPAGIKADLAARGIVKEHGEKLMPAWILRSTLYWRQVFPAGKRVTLTLTYQPVVGRPTGSLAAFEKSGCLDAALARRLETMLNRNTRSTKIKLTALSFQAPASAAWSDPIERYRLTIEKPSTKAEIATCRNGLVLESPTQLETSAQDYAHEEDLSVLFIEGVASGE